MHDSNTCNTFRIHFKGEQPRMTHSRCIARSTDIEIRFVTRSTKVFVAVSCVLFDFSYNSFNVIMYSYHI